MDRMEKSGLDKSGAVRFDEFKIAGCYQWTMASPGTGLRNQGMRLPRRLPM